MTVAASPDSARAPAALEPTLSSIPDRLRTALADGYRLECELGSGGMATVYLAEDLKHSRRVAIKVLRPELVASGDEADRFLREIRTAARLSHPLIARRRGSLAGRAP